MARAYRPRTPPSIPGWTRAIHRRKQNWGNSLAGWTYTWADNPNRGTSLSFSMTFSLVEDAAGKPLRRWSLRVRATVDAHAADYATGEAYTGIEHVLSEKMTFYPEDLDESLARYLQEYAATKVFHFRRWLRRLLDREVVTHGYERDFTAGTDRWVWVYSRVPYTRPDYGSPGLQEGFYWERVRGGAWGKNFHRIPASDRFGYYHGDAVAPTSGPDYERVEALSDEAVEALYALGGMDAVLEALGAVTPSRAASPCDVEVLGPA